jgi:two-component system nitrogen regulation response regulator NtrX
MSDPAASAVAFELPPVTSGSAELVGCSKVVVAAELHERGRAAGQFVKVVCDEASGMLDEHLFGTPAPSPSDLELVTTGSRLAAARGGTLFLQDVSELPARVQERMARVARDGEVQIDGDGATARVRLIADAPVTIDSDVLNRRFRKDLYRRLAGSRLDLPPLRDRREDVPELSAYLLDQVCSARRVPRRRFADATLALLSALDWPGNLAELKDLLERVVDETSDEFIRIEQIVPMLRLTRARPSFSPVGTLREARTQFERNYVSSVLQHHGWRVAAAARTLGIQRPNLYRKARQLGIPVSRLAE